MITINVDLSGKVEEQFLALKKHSKVQKNTEALRVIIQDLHERLFPAPAQQLQEVPA